MACTKNGVTLCSEGVGRATGYQNIHKSGVGDAGSTHNDVWGTLDASSRLSSVFFCKNCAFIFLWSPTYHDPLGCTLVGVPQPPPLGCAPLEFPSCDLQPCNPYVGNFSHIPKRFPMSCVAQNKCSSMQRDHNSVSVVILATPP